MRPSGRSRHFERRPTEQEVKRSNAFLAAVLGPEEVARLDGEAVIDRQHNFPPEPIEAEPSEPIAVESDPLAAARDRVDKEVAAADEWAAEITAIEDEEAASQLADKLDQLDRLWKLYDGQRDAEKRPHDEASAAVQRKWKPLLDKLALCKAALTPLKTAWHNLKQKRLDEEREAKRREAEELQRRADELAEQAKADSRNVVTNMANAMDAAQEAERKRKEAAAVPQRAQTRGYLGGRTHSLRTVWKADLAVIEEAFEHYKSKAEVRDLLTRLANADARAGVRWIPGFYVHKEEV